MKTYGKIIPNLTIYGQPAPYGVVNERAIRATAGIMFLIGIFTFFYIYVTKDYRAITITVSLFWLDFFLKTVFQPRASYFNWLGKILTRKQRPEYVGAIQKRFAWGIGLTMATAMMIVAVLLEIRGTAPMAICFTCLFFMWMESALGVCVGCKIYGWLLKKNLIKQPEYKPACPGGACSINKH